MKLNKSGFCISASMCVLLLSLAGCNPFQKKITCSDEAGLKVVQSIIQNQMETDLRSTDFELSKIRAGMAQMNLSMSAIRTSKIDPNSTRVYCEADLMVTPSPTMMEDINFSFKELGLNVVYRSLEKYLEQYGLERSATAANSYKSTIVYNMQPTDDGKQIVAEIEGGNIERRKINNGLKTMLLLSLQKAPLLASQEEARQKALEAEQNHLMREQEQIRNEAQGQISNEAQEQIRNEAQESLNRENRQRANKNKTKTNKNKTKTGTQNNNKQNQAQHDNYRQKIKNDWDRMMKKILQ